MENFKNIHIGELIKARWVELDISMDRTCKFFSLNYMEILEMFEQKNMNTDYLLRWSKLLEYDFFRLYTHHLILFSPPSAGALKKTKTAEKGVLPRFRKNVYTRQIIDFILGLIITGEKTKLQVMEEYKIPKTTLYTWLSKYGQSK